ncbi:MAG: bifunctional isocitrate dehydrogenase kinase/phosphatase [Verrucomicrobia bacterium]|nr:MAG: bifunctional isocitrate dehydrogenase kinase/phosphatase [Verrucomicrobiota bacterium]
MLNHRARRLDRSRAVPVNPLLLPVSPPLTDSRLAALCAEEICTAFRRYEHGFDAITRRARERFLARDWRGSFDDAAERLRVYSQTLDEIVPRIVDLMQDRLYERQIWSAIKAVYSSLVCRLVRWEIAESFFNSLTRRVFATEGIDQAIEFVDSDFDTPPQNGIQDIRRSYSGRDLRELICQLLTNDDAGFARWRWNDLERAAGIAAERIQKMLPPSEEYRIETVATVFYRARGAYIVGAVQSNKSTISIAFCLRHPDERGIMLDALLHGEADLAILFSYTRAYFRVEAPSSFELVRRLRDLMPNKRLADLYNATGFNRHAKTEFYRDFVRHLQNSTDQFVPTEGARGMVMLVFTLPSYDAVFKVIRDHSEPPKENDRADVMRRYRIVFEHDRAGRLVEAHEFEHLRIRRERFDPTLLRQLLSEARETVRVDNQGVIINHAYVERRVRPLNIFLAEAQDDSAISATCDYAQAIKDLAASNIFPGDLLTKNFGLTRRRRVVFYDYDELCFLTECNFRDLPQPKTYDEELAAEPWFTVHDNDIFPEEFLNFLAFPQAARKVLLDQHGELFRPDFWRAIQQKLRAGELPEIFPYTQERRLAV